MTERGMARYRTTDLRTFSSKPGPHLSRALVLPTRERKLQRTKGKTPENATEGSRRVRAEHRCRSSDAASAYVFGINPEVRVFSARWRPSVLNPQRTFKW